MTYSLVSDEAFLDLAILQEKIGAALNCMLDNGEGRYVQTLAAIAGDYLSAMDDIIDAMQKTRVAPPPCN